MAHVLVGEPVSTSPEHARAGTLIAPANLIETAFDSSSRPKKLMKLKILEWRMFLSENRCPLFSGICAAGIAMWRLGKGVLQRDRLAALALRHELARLRQEGVEPRALALTLADLEFEIGRLIEAMKPTA